MPVLQHLPIFQVRIEGQYVPDGFMDDVQEIIVDLSLYLPEMVTIRLHDPKLAWVNNQALLDLGKTLEIQVLPQGEAKSKVKSLVEVEISAIEPTFLGSGASSLMIRGYNRSGRLHLGRYSRTFTHRSDADIAREIADEIGLEADVDPTGVEYEYVLQNNQTHMEFLATRAQRIGYQVYADKQKLYFKQGDSTVAGETGLKLGEELRTFRPRISTMQQASSVKVYGWDPLGKQPVSAEARSNEALNQGGMKQSGAKLTAQQLGIDRFPARLVDSPISSIDEADAIASGLMNDIDYRFQEADGICAGNPEVRAGRKLDLKGLGKRFDGKYFVTSAQHIYDGQGYRVEFAVNGRQPNTMQRLLRTRNGQTAGYTDRLYGVVIGLVTNLQDPQQLGRVKVKFPWVLDNADVEIESAWAKVVNPSAGQGEKGFYFLPEVDDEVLIAFEHGDVNRPYLLGALWNLKDKPPKANSEVVKNGKVIERIIQSRLHHQIILNDSDDKPSVTIKTQGNHQIMLDDTPSGPIIRIQTNGGHKIELDDAPGSKSITLVDSTGQNKLKLDSTMNAGLLQVAGELTLQANGPIKILSSAAVEVVAPVIKLN